MLLVKIVQTLLSHKTHKSALISYFCGTQHGTALYCETTASASWDASLLSSVHWYLLCLLPKEGWPGWVDLGGRLLVTYLYGLPTCSAVHTCKY